jgi:hypothetical protein
MIRLVALLCLALGLSGGEDRIHLMAAAGSIGAT